MADALASFDPLWQSLTPAEQAQLIHLLVEKVEFDGTRGMVTLRLQPTGINAYSAAWVRNWLKQRRMRR